MNSFAAILTTDTGTTGTGSTQGSLLFIIIYIAIFAAIIYFMMIRPQKKQKAKTEEMLSQMAAGDNIMTTSGFYGTIIDIVDDTTIIVEFGNNRNCRIPMHKNAVAELEKASAGVVSNDAADKEADKVEKADKTDKKETGRKEKK